MSAFRHTYIGTCIVNQYYHLVMASKQKFLVPSYCGMVIAAMNKKFLQPLGPLEIEAKLLKKV